MVIFKSAFKPVPLATDSFGDRILTKIWENSIKYPRKKAVISAEDETNYVTYLELYSQSLSVASFLAQHNFGKEDVAALVMQNSLYFAPIFIGCALQGGIITSASISNTHCEFTT